MSLYNLPNATNGMDSVLIQLTEEVPVFIPALLTFIYFTIFIGGMVAQRKREGNEDIAMWMTVAGIITIVATLPLTLVSGVLNVTYLVVLSIVTILSGFWLLFKDRF